MTVRLDQGFADALSEHLAALQARDIERFARTIGDDAALVGGRGEVTEGRDAVLRAHRDWFASADPWSFQYELRLSRVFADAAFALIDVTYREGPDARAARFLLTLIFARTQNGEWQFVYDQNTPLADAV